MTPYGIFILIIGTPKMSHVVTGSKSRRPVSISIPAKLLQRRARARISCACMRLDGGAVFAICNTGGSPNGVEGMAT